MARYEVIRPFLGVVEKYVNIEDAVLAETLIRNGHIELAEDVKPKKESKGND